MPAYLALTLVSGTRTPLRVGTVNREDRLRDAFDERAALSVVGQNTESTKLPQPFHRIIGQRPVGRQKAASAATPATTRSR